MAQVLIATSVSDVVVQTETALRAQVVFSPLEAIAVVAGVDFIPDAIK
jgi:hypothetical protein